ncbi:hypothetical protein [Saccharospirillum salsuginis]|uniref:Uncharacterized protein n=1 Tax=Saccharospirillum salsuginis TaxID=418750 RepID=A0A918N4S3_9GAMM|nr:hypothetical protein [Saccharospirillum salsuginis]GGX39210.1 hypothetical protein GCM10007392_01930 [Saccharospirillum salsuginis]
MDTQSVLPLKELTVLQKVTLQRLYKREAEGEQLEPNIQFLLEAYRSEWQFEAQKARRFWPMTLMLGLAVYGCMLFYTFAPEIPFLWQ